jgi:hypothetical protein
MKTRSIVTSVFLGSVRLALGGQVFLVGRLLTALVLTCLVVLTASAQTVGMQKLEPIFSNGGEAWMEVSFMALGKRAKTIKSDDGFGGGQATHEESSEFNWNVSGLFEVKSQAMGRGQTSFRIVGIAGALTGKLSERNSFTVSGRDGEGMLNRRTDVPEMLDSARGICHGAFYHRVGCFAPSRSAA